MIISVIYLVISFILDNFMSNILPSTLNNVSLFNTIYIVISLVVIYPYFNNDKKYYVLALIFGILFDTLYTGTFMFNAILFVVICILIKFFNNIFPSNIFTINIISLCSVISYYVISFVIFNLIGNIEYDIILLLDIIIKSIIMTIIYTSISYFVMKYVYNRFNVKLIK